MTPIEILALVGGGLCLVASVQWLGFAAGLERGRMRAYRDTLHRLDRAMAEDRRILPDDAGRGELPGSPGRRSIHPHGRAMIEVSLAHAGTLDRHNACPSCGEPMFYRVDKNERPLSMFCVAVETCDEALKEHEMSEAGR